MLDHMGACSKRENFRVFGCRTNFGEQLIPSLHLSPRRREREKAARQYLTHIDDSLGNLAI